MAGRFARHTEPFWEQSRRADWREMGEAELHRPVPSRLYLHSGPPSLKVWFFFFKSTFLYPLFIFKALFFRKGNVHVAQNSVVQSQVFSLSPSPSATETTGSPCGLPATVCICAPVYVMMVNSTHRLQLVVSLNTCKPPLHHSLQVLPHFLKGDVMLHWISQPQLFK